MFITRSRYSTLSKSVTIAIVCLFLVNSITWAVPSEILNPSKSATLAPESRLDPFVDEHLPNFKDCTTLMYAVGRLRDLVRGKEIRDSHIVKLNKELRDNFHVNTVEIDRAIEPGSLPRDKEYALATFNFKKEGKKIKVLFLKNYAGSASLTTEDRDELKKFGIEKDTDFNHLDSPGLLYGVWFVNPADESTVEGVSGYSEALKEATAELAATGSVDMVALGKKQGLTEAQLTELAKKVRSGQGVSQEGSEEDEARNQGLLLSFTASADQAIAQWEEQNRKKARFEDRGRIIYDNTIRPNRPELIPTALKGFFDYMRERLNAKEINEQEMGSALIGVVEWLTRKGYPEHLVAKLRDLNAEGERGWEIMILGFFRELPFGTAGKRGIQVDERDGYVLPGPNYLNDYTVAEYTIGLARYLQKTAQASRGVVLGGDTRVNSVLPYHNETSYTELEAKILRKMGVKIIRFIAPRSIGQAAWAVSRYDAASAEYNSASHNRWPDNGVKALNEFSAQLFPNERNSILAEIENVKPEDLSVLDLAGFDLTADHQQHPDEHILLGGPADIRRDPSVINADTPYIGFNQSFTTDLDLVKQYSGTVRSYYTPVHGVGIFTAPETLNDEKDFRYQITVLKSQASQDAEGRFGTVEKPDPNFHNPKTGARTMDQAIAEAERLEREAGVRYDFVWGSDPDFDRTVYAVRSREGKWEILRANDAWALLTWYKLNQLRRMREEGRLRPEQKVLFEKGYLIKTWVTSDLLKEIAEDPQFGLKVFEPAVGFNKIGEVALKEIALPILAARHSVKADDILKNKVITLNDLCQALGIGSRQQLVAEINSILRQHLALGAEESNGISPGGHALEKVGDSASIMFHEVAAFVKAVNADKKKYAAQDPYLKNYFETFGWDKDLTIHELLNRVYLEYGYHASENIPLEFTGLTGLSQKQRALSVIDALAEQANTAADTPEAIKIGGRVVERVVDGSKYTSTPSVAFKEPGYRFTLKGGDWLATRPSGTEPYIRVYANLRVPKEKLTWQNIENEKRTADGQATTLVLTLSDTIRTKVEADKIHKEVKKGHTISGVSPSDTSLKSAPVGISAPSASYQENVKGPRPLNKNPSTTRSGIQIPPSPAEAGNKQFERRRKIFEEIAASVKKLGVNLRSFARDGVVLVTGFGEDGFEIVTLSQELDLPKKIIGIDWIRDKVKKANKDLKLYGLKPYKAVVVEGDLRHLKDIILNGSIRMIYMVGVLPNSHTSQKGLENIIGQLVEALEPGGIIVLRPANMRVEAIFKEIGNVTTQTTPHVLLVRKNETEYDKATQKFLTELPETKDGLPQWTIDAIKKDELEKGKSKAIGPTHTKSDVGINLKSKANLLKKTKIMLDKAFVLQLGEPGNIGEDLEYIITKIEQGKGVDQDEGAVETTREPIYAYCGPCVFILIHAPETHETYCDHFSGIGKKELLIIDEHLSKLKDLNRVKIAVGGANLDFEREDPKSAHDKVESILRTRETLMSHLRSKPIPEKNIMFFFADRANLDTSMYFDPKKSLLILKFGYSENTDTPFIPPYRKIAGNLGKVGIKIPESDYSTIEVGLEDKESPLSTDKLGESLPALARKAVPPGSISGVFKYLCDHDITTVEGAISGEILAKSAGEENGVRQKALSFESIEDDLRGLLLHLHLIEKAPGNETGKDARYYVPEAVKRKSAEILPILARFKGKNLRPKVPLLKQIYEEKIKPILKSELQKLKDAYNNGETLILRNVINGEQLYLKPGADKLIKMLRPEVNKKSIDLYCWFISDKNDKTLGGMSFYMDKSIKKDARPIVMFEIDIYYNKLTGKTAQGTGIGKTLIEWVKNICRDGNLLFENDGSKNPRLINLYKLNFDIKQVAYLDKASGALVTIDLPKQEDIVKAAGLVVYEREFDYEQEQLVLGRFKYEPDKQKFVFVPKKKSTLDIARIVFDDKDRIVVVDSNGNPIEKIAVRYEKPVKVKGLPKAVETDLRDGAPVQQPLPATARKTGPPIAPAQKSSTGEEGIPETNPENAPLPIDESLEKKVANAFKEFAAECRKEMELIRKAVESKNADEIKRSVDRAVELAMTSFKGPEIELFQEIIVDMMNNIAPIKYLIFRDRFQTDLILEALDMQEAALKELEKLADAEMLLRAKEARIRSGVFDVSLVLGQVKGHIEKGHTVSRVSQSDTSPESGGTVLTEATPVALVAATQSEADRIHTENLSYTPTIPEKTILCHITADSILSDAQQKEGILNRLDIAMRDKSYNEKMVELKVNSSEDFIQQVKDKIQDVKDYYRAEYGEKEYKNYTFKFDVACPSIDIVARVKNELGLPALAFGRKEGDIVQIEGIMLALRTLYNTENSLEALCTAFEILTGARPDMTDITNIDEFARRRTFILPTVKSINDYEKLNRLIEENIKTAA